ncbi:MAG: DNA polymerase III subunit delta [Candidatus Andersenbacteria bacterium]
MVEYFFGEDTRGARTHIAQHAHTAHADVVFIDEEDIKISSVESVFDKAQNSLFGKTTLILRDPLDYSQAIREDILSRFETLPAHADIIFWQRGNPDARSALHKFLSKHAAVKKFPAITTPQQGLAWIEAYIKNNYSNIVMSGDAMLLLLEITGFDTYTLASELDKLCAYKINIQKNDVESIVPERTGAILNAFPLLEAITAKNKKSSLKILNAMLETGASERFITSMIAYQFRLFLAVRMGVENGNPASVAKLSKMHPIAIQKATPIVRRLSLSVIHDALARIASVERSMNSNNTMDDKSIVTMLVTGLSS